MLQRQLEAVVAEQAQQELVERPVRPEAVQEVIMLVLNKWLQVLEVVVVLAP